MNLGDYNLVKDAVIARLLDSVNKNNVVELEIAYAVNDAWNEFIDVQVSDFFEAIVKNSLSQLKGIESDSSANLRKRWAGVSFRRKSWLPPISVLIEFDSADYINPIYGVSGLSENSSQAKNKPSIPHAVYESLKMRASTVDLECIAEKKSSPHWPLYGFIPGLRNLNKIDSVLLMTGQKTFKNENLVQLLALDVINLIDLVDGVESAHST